MGGLDRHGPLSECPISLEESFIAEYLGLPEDSSQRKRYERRYGLSIIQRLVKKFKEDQANRDWLKSSTMACPICQVRVEKSVGCNHVCIFRFLRFDSARWMISD